ncbi:MULTISPECIES: hypothetical protein [unclassified Nocardiopsis]|uniref:hypothetical protein n=1 Tax=Nocardiopsis TaxID=2013 RepID=UPI00387B1A66
MLELRRGRGAVIVKAPAPDSDHVRSTLAAFVAAVREAGLSPEAATTLLKEALQ